MEYFLQGKDTLKYNDTILSSTLDGDIGKVSFSDDIQTLKVGKNKNVVYMPNMAGYVATLELRLMRGSADDKLLNSDLSSLKQDPTTFSLIRFEFTKNYGDGAGTPKSETYVLTGGIFTKALPDMVENVEGDVSVGLSFYTLKFANAERLIG